MCIVNFVYRIANVKFKETTLSGIGTEKLEDKTSFAKKLKNCLHPFLNITIGK